MFDEEESKRMRKSWFPEIYFYHLKKNSYYPNAPLKFFRFKRNHQLNSSSNEAHTDPGYSK